MSTLLLSTKLYIPPVRPQLVPRPRLIERLGEVLHHTTGVTLVSAPAGFGKTTLVAEWLRQLKDEGGGMKDEKKKLQPYQAAWLSLDEGDNDPTRFFTYLVAALQQIDSRIGPTVQEMLQAGGPQLLSSESLVTILINDVVAYCGEGRLILVLDDYHLIEAEAVHHALTFLLDHLPPLFHLVIASRTVPPLPLSRLRARGRLTELRAADLRFTSTEIAEFLNTIMGLGLSAGDVAALEARTEGWIAGLQLAALSLQEQTNRSEFIKAFTGDDRYILDYLLDEVFSRQPETVQNFLLQTSILDRLCGPLCDAVTQFTIYDLRFTSEEANPGIVNPKSEIVNGQAMLEYLEQTNLFIVPLDNKREWYRYHPLLLDLLRHRFNSEMSRQKLGDTGLEQSPRAASNLQSPSLLHHRAASWYEQHGLTAEALSHLFAAEDFAEAVRLVEQIGATTLWKRGEVTTLLSWLKKLPLELIHARPKLCLYEAETLYLTGQLGAIEPLLRSAELHLPDVPDEVEARNMRGEVMSMRALVAGMQGSPAQTDEAIELIHQALAHLSPEELRLRGLLTIGLAEAYYLNGWVVEAADHYLRAIDLGHASHNPFLVIAGMTRLADVQIIQGQLRRAAETCQAMQQPALASVHLGGSLVWSEVLREWNQLAAAKEQVQESLTHGEFEGNLRLLVQAQVSLARILQAEGNLDGAIEAIYTAAQTKLHHQISIAGDMPPVAAYQAWLWLGQGDVTAAARWAQEQNLSPADEPNYRVEVEHLILARVLLAEDRAPEAIGLLERVRQAAEAAGRLGRVIEALMLQALAYQAQNDLPTALTTLNQALILAEPEGYVRLFVDEGAPMAKLLGRMKAESGRMKEYIKELLTILTYEGSQPAKEEKILQPLIEPLTERELEILQLIAGGLSNAEIAEKLFLTLGTVKVHTRNIYGKMGVGSRTQAIVQARNLGLLLN